MTLTREQFNELHRRGLSVDQIVKLEQAHMGPADMPSGSGAIESLSPEHDIRARVAQALHLLPNIGSTVGGMVGASAAGVPAIPSGPGALLAATAGGTRGAAIGGGLGKAGEIAGDTMLGYDAPSTPRALLDVGLSAGEGALTQRLANAAGLAAKPAARGLYRFSLGLAKNVRKTFGDMAEAGLRKRIPVDRGGAAQGKQLGEAAEQAVGKYAKGTKAEAERAWSAAVDRVNQILDTAHQHGLTVHVDDVKQPLIETAEKNLGRPLKDYESRMLNRMVRRELDDLTSQGTYGLRMAPRTSAKMVTKGGVAKEVPGVDEISPRAGKIAKQAGQNMSKGFYRGRSQGMTVGARPERTADVARGVRQGLEAMEPSIGPAEARVAETIGLRRAQRVPTAGTRYEQAWRDIPATGEADLADLTRRSRAAIDLERAVTSGRRNAPLNPRDFPTNTGDPQLDALIGQSREGVGLERALNDAASRREHLALPLMAGGAAFAGAHDPRTALITAILARTALSPAVTSRIAMGLDTPAAAGALSAVPRISDTLLQQMLFGAHPPEDTRP